VRLNTNESPEPPPAAFLEELSEAARHLEAHRYPDREATALRSAIAASHSREAAEVFAANGSNEVLQCLLLAYGGPGRRALVFEPTYALHSHIARITSTEVVAAERDRHFAVDAAAACRLIEREQPKVVFLCSPNNPTGNSERRETIEAIAGVAEGLVVVDEAYAQFARWSAVDLLDRFPAVAVVRTFSKTWALAGLRLGYLLAHAEVVAACRAVALPYHLDALKQHAGVAALGHAEEMHARVARLVAQRDRLEAGLGELPVDTWPSEANFVLFRARSRRAEEVWQGLAERSVLVRDVSGFSGLEGCLRVTVGTAEENARFLAALSEVLGEGPSVGSAT
jgi:histidinol-phosphate aminotransferase